ncbi:MAG: DNA gyrase subunit A [Hydrogenophilus sp.]|nr:DNA gyrase subunit A [Hydrogenophilus sp.]
MELFAREVGVVSLEEEMRRSYLDYAMSVIVGRALPDARDGLKPVHRRVLYAMHELGNDWNKPYKKSARVVGDVIGKYHPHGDAAVYEAIVRMAQDFSLRYPLIDGQGNFGSIDGDAPAAMRYTEVRMARIGHELLADIEKETVDFGPNYDNTEREPLVLPTRIPNLLINGASGIAVGMATNIPPHNLREVIDGSLLLLEDPEISIEALMEVIPAPDFPTGGLIVGVEGAREGYRTGRGRVVMRARTHVEMIGRGGNERPAIVVDELPYQVNKRLLIERIAELVSERRLEAVTDIRDESDKSGLRVVIELRRGERPEVVLNQLFKLTQLQESFGINLVALVEGRPQTLTLKELLQAFLDHRRVVVVRRTAFELRKARERGHLLEGLAVALANMDAMIAVIQSSPTPAAAKERLMGRVWPAPLVAEMLARAGERERLRPEGLPAGLGLTAEGYRLSEGQAEAILAMRLQRLTALEREKIVAEYQEVVAQITDLLDVLARPERVTAIIAEELRTVKEQYGDPRRTEIVEEVEEIRLEDLIAPHDVVVTLTHSGYVKRQPLDDYRAQRRGGRGKVAAATREDDFAEQLFVANSHDWLLCFSNRGRVYWLRVFELPEGNRTGRGKPIVNLLPMQGGERIEAVLAVRDFADDAYLVFATAQGIVKKTSLAAFANPRKSGIVALALEDGDRLVGVVRTDGCADIMLFSDAGKAVRFAESEVRPMGREARGVRGMALEEGQRVVAMVSVADGEEKGSLLLATERGFGKRTAVSEFARHGRGTKGIIAIQKTARNGALVGACLVTPEDEVMLLSQNGVLIRTRVADVREMGRAAQGVTLMALEAQDTLAAVVKVVEGPNGEAGIENEIGE